MTDASHDRKTIPQWLRDKHITISMSEGRRLTFQAILKLDGKEVSISEKYTEPEMIRMEMHDGRIFVEAIDQEWYAQATAHGKKQRG